MASPSPPPPPSTSCFWCHSCHRVVRLPSPSMLLCPLCSGGFVEEINGVSLQPSSAFFLSDELRPHSRSRREIASHAGRSPFSQVREMLSTWSLQARPSGLIGGEVDGWRSDDIESLDRMFRRRGDRSEPLGRAGNDGFELWLGLGSRRSDPAPSFFHRVQSIFGRRRGGAGIGFGSHHNPTSERLMDMRSFLLGPAGDLLIQQMIEGGELGRTGSTPASKAAVEAMPTLIISQPSLDADGVYCAVCKEVFDAGVEAREMPCKHIYHTNCILPWLALHNSCPICRHEMPSEVLADNRRPGEGLNTHQADGTSGQRGLAIVGIPGIGILVRSFSLFGNAAHNEANVENEVANLNSVAQTSNMSADGVLRQSESTDGDVSATLTTCNNERGPSGSTTVGALWHSNSVDVANTQTHGITSHEESDIDSGSGGQAVSRSWRRNFSLWLSRPVGSYLMRSASTVNMEASGSGSGARRRRLLFRAP